MGALPERLEHSASEITPPAPPPTPPPPSTPALLAQAKQWAAHLQTFPHARLIGYTVAALFFIFCAKSLVLGYLEYRLSLIPPHELTLAEKEEIRTRVYKAHECNAEWRTEKHGEIAVSINDCQNLENCKMDLATRDAAENPCTQVKSCADLVRWIPEGHGYIWLDPCETEVRAKISEAIGGFQWVRTEHREKATDSRNLAIAAFMLGGFFLPRRFRLIAHGAVFAVPCVCFVLLFVLFGNSVETLSAYAGGALAFALVGLGFFWITEWGRYRAARPPAVPQVAKSVMATPTAPIAQTEF